jgi:hypothetical protein
MASRSKPTTTSLYTYSAKRTLRAEEIAAYKRIGLVTLLIVGLLVGGYFLGVPIIAQLGGGNANPASSNTPLGTTDNIPPASPKLDSLPDATRVRTLTVSGSAESGATVIVTINGQDEEPTLADKDGLFKHVASLAGGNNTISATATDKAGNKSRASKSLAVLYDATPPKMTITHPSQEINSVTTPSIVIQGKTEPDAQVTVNDRQAIIQADGTFSASLNLSPGNNVITIVATDKAGNTAKTTRTITSTYGQSSASAQPTPLL